MRRLITVAIAVLAMTSLAFAQDEFNVNTNPSASANPGGGNCAATYQAAMEKLNEQELTAQGEEQKDIQNCNHDQPCVDAAVRKFAAAHTQVQKGQCDADANQQICNSHVTLAGALAFDAQKPDPCQAQYDQTMSGLYDQETLAADQEQKDILDCILSQANDSSCRDEAIQKFAAAHNKIQNGQTDADAARSICVSRKTAAQSGTQAPTNPGGAAVPSAAAIPFSGLSGGVAQNTAVPGAAPSGAGGTQAPNSAPGSSTGLTGGVSQNAPATAANSTPANGPASSGTPAPGIPEVPRLAPVTGPASGTASGPAPMKPLQGGVSKSVTRNPAPGNVANNQSAGSPPASYAGSNAGPAGVGKGPNAQASVAAGPLRFVREGADWIAKHLPGGESGVRAAADYTKQLKQPFEDRWTKQSDGGIREVGETVAGHGIGKVAGKLLGAVASKIAQTPLGRAILSKFPKAPKLFAGAATDASEASEGGATGAGRNSPPQRGQGPQEQARNQPQNSGGSNNSANNRLGQSQPPGQNSPQQQARNDPRLQAGAGGFGSKAAKSIGIPQGAIKKGDLVLGRWDQERGLQKWTREQGGITVEDEGLTPKNYDPSDPFLRQYGGSPYVQAVKDAATRGKQIHFDLNEIDVPRYLKGDCHTCGELKWIRDNWSNWNRSFPNTPLPKFYRDGVELTNPPWLS